MARVVTPIDLMNTSLQFVTLMAETQVVMAYRMMGMAGIWSVTPHEKKRTVEAKGPAFMEAMLAGTMTAARGQSPDRVMRATMAPLSRKTASNRRRLAKRGLKTK